MSTTSPSQQSSYQARRANNQQFHELSKRLEEAEKKLQEQETTHKRNNQLMQNKIHAQAREMLRTSTLEKADVELREKRIRDLIKIKSEQASRIDVLENALQTITEHMRNMQDLNSFVLEDLISQSQSALRIRENQDANMRNSSNKMQQRMTPAKTIEAAPEQQHPPVQQERSVSKLSGTTLPTTNASEIHNDDGHTTPAYSSSSDDSLRVVRFSHPPRATSLAKRRRTISSSSSEEIPLAEEKRRRKAKQARVE